MKVSMSPSWKRNWKSLVSRRTRSTVSAERKRTLFLRPSIRFFISTCIYAPPLPGCVCWIFTARQMPPSYSMMLPGRMSTPLIFMSSLGESGGKEPPQPLARGPFPGKQRVGIDRRPLPPALPLPHRVNGEMEVWAGGACIAGVPDAADHLASLHLLTFMQSGSVGREVGVIILPLRIRRALVDRDSAAAVAEKQLLDRPVSSGDDRR